MDPESWKGWIKLEYHLLDTGHFALEEEGDTIARTPPGRGTGQR
jgi:hypothetical protein